VIEKLEGERSRKEWKNLTVVEIDGFGKKIKAMTLGHLAGIITIEELRNVRKKPRKRWKDRTAMTIECFRNGRKIMTRVPFTDRSRNKGWRNLRKRKT
jgi:hypothetical protein